MKTQSGLYLIADPALCTFKTLYEVVQEAALNGASLVQLRNKNGEKSEIIEQANEILKILKPFKIPLIINDYLDIALEVKAQGVHLGQSDLSALMEAGTNSLQRDFAKLKEAGSIIGITANSMEHLLECNKMQISYVGLGPIFFTHSKERLAPTWGVEKLKQAVLYSRHPIYAIGGVNQNNSGEVIKAGPAGIVVLSAICSSNNPGEATKEIVQKIRQSRLNEQTIINLSKQENIPADITAIGDDCAVTPFNDTDSQLTTCDLLTEGIHFLKTTISPLALGYKALAVNISDIAAMGGTPEHAFLSVALPANTATYWYEDFITGVKELANTCGIKILGGDTSRSPGPIFINITLTGKANSKNIIYRSGAKSGDVLCTTGFLGNSAAGFFCLMNKIKNDALIKAHHYPTPRLAEGQFLATQAISSMMDISDGLFEDSRKLCEASKVGAKINIEQIPTDTTLEEFAKSAKFDSKEIALIGGEDYELLFTVPQSLLSQVQESYKKQFNKDFYILGEITDDSEVTYKRNGTAYFPKLKPYQHFQ